MNSLINSILVFSLSLFLGNLANAAQRPFISVWKTTTADETITVPINPNYADDPTWYNYSVDCGNDGSIEHKAINHTVSCTFADAGEHPIAISGDFAALAVGNLNADAASKLQDVSQWGDIIWKDFTAAFQNAVNLQISASDQPQLAEQAISFQQMFNNCTAFNSPIGHWNVSSVSTMQGMFSGASAFNQDLSHWDISQLNELGNFLDGTAFSQTNYDALLLSWSELNFKHDLNLSVAQQYSNNAAVNTARNSLASKINLSDHGSIPTLSTPTQPITVDAPNFSVSGTAANNALIKLYKDANNNGVLDAGEQVVAQQQLSTTSNTFSLDVQLSSTGTEHFLLSKTLADKEYPPIAIPAITYIDTTAPTVTINHAPTQVSDTQVFNITLTSSENLSDFTIDDIQLSNASATNFQATSANTYSIDITPDGNGDIRISIAANAATDPAGNGNTATTTVIGFGNVAPTLNISSSRTNLGGNHTNATLTFSFSEEIHNFTVDDISVSHGIISNFSGTDDQYTARFTAPTDTETDATISVAAGSYENGDGDIGTASSINLVIDTLAPQLTEVIAINTPTTDTTPNYTFNSTSAGHINYDGACSSNTTTATTGNNNITLNNLVANTYTDCSLSVVDSAGNSSTPLRMTTFIISAATANIEVQGGSTFTTIQNDDTSPNAHDGTKFGRITSSQTFRIYNTGNSTLSLNATPSVQLLNDTDNAFSITQPSITEIAADDSTNFSITFTPQQGISTATVVITSNDDENSSYRFTIQGGSNVPPIAPRAEHLRIFLANDANHTPLQRFQNIGGNIRFAFDLIDSDGGDYNYTWSSPITSLQNLLTGLPSTLENNTVISDPLNISDLAAGKYPISVSVVDNSFTTMPSYHASADYILEVIATPISNDANNRDDDGDGISNDIDTAPRQANHIPSHLDTSSKYHAQVSTGHRLRLGLVAQIAAQHGLQISINDLRNYGNNGQAASNTSLDRVTFNHIFDYIIEGVALPANPSNNSSGNSVALVIPLVTPLNSRSTFHKYHATTGWSLFASNADNTVEWAAWLNNQVGVCPAPNSASYNATTTKAGKNCLRLRIQDGGPNDQDGKVDGRIIDPFAVTNTPASTALDEDRPPSITTKSPLEIDEGGYHVTMIKAVDSNDDELRYHLITGAEENALFTFDVHNGELRFKRAPDYEYPHDTNNDNIYTVMVAASDQVFTVTKTLEIHIYDLDEDKDTINNGPPVSDDEDDSDPNNDSGLDDSDGTDFDDDNDLDNSDVDFDDDNNSDDSNVDSDDDINKQDDINPISSIVSQECEQGTEGITAQYIAFFNRAPDAEGLHYWAQESGLTLEEIGTSFFNQAETQETYPPETSNFEFIIQVYHNLFGRIPDAGGLDYWVNELDNGRIYRNLTILAFINGAQGADKTLLDNKTAIGCYYTKQTLIGGQTLAHQIMQTVTATNGSVAHSKTLLNLFRKP